MKYILRHDYETRSEANLKKLGAVRYAQHSSTEIMFLSYKLGNEKTKLWSPVFGEKIPNDLFEYLHDDDVRLSAHNAFFENCVTRFVLPKLGRFQPIPISRYKCTAAKAAAVALPRALADVGRILELGIQKDPIGEKLIQRYSKPRSQWTREKKGDKYFSDREGLLKFGKYCMTDTEAEKMVDEALPDLIPNEQLIWEINQEMNLRGVQVDVSTAKKIRGLLNEENFRLKKEIQALTNGKIQSAAQRDVVLNYLLNEGLDIPDLRKKTLTDLQSSKDWEDVSDRAKRIIEIRQDTSMTSNKKYNTMLNIVNDEGRVTDLALYHGASTGREAAKGLQLHNLPKGNVKNTNLAIEIIKDFDLDTIRLFYPKPFQLFSSCIRGMVTASPGKELFVADYNAIEARILAWIAGYEEGLKNFREGKDPYIKQACRIFDLSPEEIDEAMRYLGKVSELGSGYQMGPPKFLQTCLDWGVNPDLVNMDIAKKAIKAYRDSHTEVVLMWSRIENAAIKAVRENVKVSCNKVSFFMWKKFLMCQLPSGRCLAYFKPTIRNEPTPWGEMRPKLYHWGVDSYTKKWVNSATYGGKLVENICQGIGRDVTFNGVKNVKAKNYDYLFQVHDEVATEILIGKGDLALFEKAMSALPKWADGLPITAKAWKGPRFKK